MHIRKTTTKDLEQILALYKRAREFMAANGNPLQWPEGYPPKSALEQDILTGKSYVCEQGDLIIATFYFAVEPDPTYAIIQNGSWLNDAPYGVIHRITTSGSIKGTASYCIDWCLSQCHNLRIDTHEDNIPMHNLLIKNKFTKCGIVRIRNNEKRVAYQRSDF